MPKIVVIQTPSEKLYATEADAQQAIAFLETLKDVSVNGQLPRQVFADGAGFRILSQSRPDVPIPVDALEARRLAGSLPAIFDHQRFAIVEDQ
jgi:hypothetical protein